MCWNYEVSFGFSILYLIINSYYVIRKPAYWKEYFLFGMFYFVMEAFQTLQWLYGNVYDNNLFGIDKCDTINANFTIVAHVLIWLQPILFSYIGYRTSHNKIFFMRFLFLNCFVLVFSLIILYAGFNMPNCFVAENSIYGLSTCTNKGITGHLVWRYKPKLLEYFPNYLMYVTSCVLSFVMYDKREIQNIGIGWLLSLIATKFILQPSLLETASSWCLLSIVANIYIMIMI
ncbi:hypothetical protein QLL95_gp0189 [Cotonvirus japonicus]|uniref:Uncharacterized protein n=1 Tax=Cotonvirus japonicus TaxID=2811091 RepID=A0ABM7NR83_9VIRU|nr:hypothetical protein QLL95_gp0189 [Cotonvirus japonicus]BCS82678.1 hypothetical protein [Cotonvirus japonicus]